MPYGGIRDSEQLRRDTIWGYPEHGASNCMRHIVPPGLDGLKATFTTGFVHRSVITERTSWFLSPKFLEKKFKIVQLCVISIEDICKPKSYH